MQLPGWNDPTVDTLRLLHQWLNNDQNGKWLFVLDNADDINILEEKLPSRFFPAGINRFFPQRASGTLLVTTRDKRIGERLAVRGKTTTVPAMDMSEGRQLFKYYLPADLSIRLNSIERLVDVLEHLPLAITQAAAYITENNVSIEKYLSILQDGGGEVWELLGESLSDDRRIRPESNSVIKTWKLSFESISKQDPRAADILSLMAMFDRQGIPAFLLIRDNESAMAFTKSMATLNNFSLVAKAGDEGIYSMHPLVQVSAQAWLELRNATFKWRQEALFILAKSFPSGDYDTWRACEALLPHTRVVLQHEIPQKDCALKRAELLQKLAWFDRTQGHHNSALSKAQEALEIFQRLEGENTPMALSNMTTVGDCLIKQDKLQEAECILRKSRILHDQALGSSHPETLRSMGNLAWVWFRQGRHEEAESLGRENLTGREQALGFDHPDTLLSMNDLSVMLIAKGSLDEAQKLGLASLVLRLQLRAPDHPDVLESQTTLAQILGGQGNYEDAEEQIRSVLESRRRVSGHLHPTTLILMHELAFYIAAQGKKTEAIQLYQSTLDIQEKVLGGSHSDTIITRFNLADELVNIGKLEEAEQHLRIIITLKNSSMELSPRISEIVADAERYLKYIENPRRDRPSRPSGLSFRVLKARLSSYIHARSGHGL